MSFQDEFKDTQALEDSWKAQVDDGFARFLAQPLTKVVLSQIPADGHELLQQLLRATWDAGATQGKASALVSLVMSLSPRK